jgi:four helix bundle protein
VDSDVEFAGYLQRGKAAASELEYLLLLARDLTYLPEDEFGRLTDEVVSVRKMLSVLFGGFDLVWPDAFLFMRYEV